MPISVENALAIGVSKAPRAAASLRTFASLARAEQRHNAQHYVQGLLSDLEDKNAEAIAYLHDQERQALQKFLGQSPWEHDPLLDELTRQVGTELGEVIDKLKQKRKDRGPTKP